MFKTDSLIGASSLSAQIINGRRSVAAGVALVTLLFGSLLADTVNAATERDFTLVARLATSGQLDSALAILDRLIYVDSSNYRLWQSRADVLRQKGDSDRLVATWMETIRHVEYATAERLDFAAMLFDSGDIDSALVLVNWVRDRSQHRSTRANLLAGQIFEIRNQPDSAMIAYRDAWQTLYGRRLF